VVLPKPTQKPESRWHLSQYLILTRGPRPFLIRPPCLVQRKQTKKKPHWPDGVAKRGGVCARRDRGEYDKAAGVAASKVIRVPVPMSAFGGKADISSGSL